MIELEGIANFLRRKRICHLRDIVNPADDSRGYQPFDGPFVFSRPCAFLGHAIDELAIGLRELRHQRTQDDQNPCRINRTVVLDNVILIQGQQIALHLADFCHIAIRKEAAHASRHASDDQILIIRIQQTMMEDVIQRLAPGDLRPVLMKRRVLLPQIFTERHRLNIQKLDLAYRIGRRKFPSGSVPPLAQLDPKKAPCRNDRKFGTFLIKILKRIQRIGAFLDLIEYDKVFCRIDLLAADN